MAVNEPEIYGTMQDIIWSRVEETNALVILVLDLFISESMEGGIGSVGLDQRQSHLSPAQGHLKDWPQTHAPVDGSLFVD